MTGHTRNAAKPPRCPWLVVWRNDRRRLQRVWVMIIDSPCRRDQVSQIKQTDKHPRFGPSSHLSHLTRSSYSPLLAVNATRSSWGAAEYEEYSQDSTYRTDTVQNHNTNTAPSRRLRQGAVCTENPFRRFSSYRHNWPFRLIDGPSYGELY